MYLIWTNLISCFDFKKYLFFDLKKKQIIAIQQQRNVSK